MEGPTAHADVFARLRGFARNRETRVDGSSAKNRREGAPPAFAAGRLSIHEADRHAQQDSAPHGHCELCSLPLAEMHRHLFEVGSKEVVCACDGCAYTFHGVAGSRYKPVPRDARALDPAVVSQIPWEQLSLPINLAFFVLDGESGGVSVYYPSPGGVTKSALPFDLLDDLLQTAGLSELEEDVEALLVNRLTQKTEAFVVPIDRCYELTGLIRVHWRGFSGGEDMRREMGAFFNRIRSKTPPFRTSSDAPD